MKISSIFVAFLENTNFKLSIWKYFSNFLTRNFHHYEEFKQSYKMIGPFTALPSICSQRSLGRHVWKNDDNVSIVLHKQERASWLDFLGFSLLFIDIEITLIWVTFGFRILLFFPLLDIKVRIFWEGHKLLRNLHLTFVYSTCRQK